jgi:hypothetical protein
MPASAPLSSRRAGYLLQCLITTAGKAKRSGGSISGSGTCRPKISYTSDGLSGLEFIRHIGGTAKRAVHRYKFALQDTDIRPGDALHSLGGEKFGDVEDIALDQRMIDIKKHGDAVDVHPEAVFAHSFVDTKVLAESLMRIGEYIADHGVEGEGGYRARPLLWCLIYLKNSSMALPRHKVRNNRA